MDSSGKYVPMLHDNYSNYKWVFALSDTSAENSARAILDRGAAFGVPKMQMSYGPCHFKTNTVRLLIQSLKAAPFLSSIFLMVQRRCKASEKICSSCT